MAEHSSNQSLIPALSNLVASSHMWLFKFIQIKLKTQFLN